MSEMNEALIQRYFEEIWNQKRVALIDAYVAPDCRIHFPAGQAHRPQSVHEWARTAFVGFPDVHFTLQGITSSGDTVVCRWLYTATNSGAFLGLQATHRRVEDEGMSWFRIAEGRIAEIWVIQDSLGLLRQLGALAEPGQDRDSSGAARNKALVHQLFDRAWNMGDLSLFDALVPPDSIDHSPLHAEVSHGAESFKRIVSTFRVALSDLVVTIEDEIAEGDRVVHRWSLRGTHTGELFGVPATGKALSMMGTTVVRLENGRVMERWANLDQLGLLRQLGVVP